MRKRLNDSEAELLGLELKPHDNDGRKPRYTVNTLQWREVESMRLGNTSKTKPNDYDPKKPFVLSAYNSETGGILNIEEYCKKYNLNYNDVTSYKFLPHHYAFPTYNIVFREKLVEKEIDTETIRDILERELNSTYTYRPKPYLKTKETVLKWADLHFGAHIRNLLLTKDYDSTILKKGLLKSVYETNNLGYKKVHVHLMGDLIESFSGLNHINSWMSLDKSEVGANAIKLCTKMLDDVFSKIDNLGSIKIVGGNHDRVSKNNDEDVKAGAADLIAWGLELIGYDVEFHPYIITHQVEGINHINLHGDKGISKKTTEDILWKYGKKGVFNFIFEAHLHSIIEKLSSSEKNKFKTVKDDAIDHRRMHCPSFFTGNYYSETLGYNSNAGYIRVFDNGNGFPEMDLRSA